MYDPETLKLSGTKPWFIKFYAPWCTHCVDLEKVWEQLREENKDKLNIAKVDCTTDEN
mgnify:CR=1 FL=1